MVGRGTGGSAGGRPIKTAPINPGASTITGNGRAKARLPQSLSQQRPMRAGGVKACLQLPKRLQNDHDHRGFMPRNSAWTEALAPRA